MTAKQAKTLTAASKIRAMTKAAIEEARRVVSREATDKWYKEKYLPEQLQKIHSADEADYLARQLKADGYTVTRFHDHCDEYYDRDYGCTVGASDIYTLEITW